MKSVCHLTSVHPTFDIRIFHKECKSLVGFGYQVTLIAPALNNEVVDGVVIKSILLPKSRIKRFFLVTSRMYGLARKQNAGLYHFHDPELMLCGVLLKLSGKKVVFDIHENVALSITSKSWLPPLIRPFIRSLYRSIERFSLLFFDALVLAEDSYLNYYPRFKSTVVLNYPIINSSIVVQQRKFELPLRFIYTGGVSVERGVWEMIKIVQRLNKEGISSTLSIIGTIWSKDLEQDLGNYIIDNNLSNQIQLINKVPFEEIEKYLQSADVGFDLLHPIPNYKESLPTKIFEYMQFGLPFILSDFPLYKRYVDESGAGFLMNPLEWEEKYSKLKELITNQALLLGMSKKGQNAVMTNYNWRVEEKKLLSLYQKLLS